MINFAFDHRFYSIELEEISFAHIGFYGDNLKRCLEISSNNCFWKIGKSKIEKHATTGMSELWKDAFSGEIDLNM